MTLVAALLQLGHMEALMHTLDFFPPALLLIISPLSSNQLQVTICTLN